MITHITCPPLEKPARIADALPGINYMLPTKSAIKKLLKKKLIKVNGLIATTATMLYGGESIEIMPDNTAGQKPILELEIDLVYEDNYLAVVNKPAGIVVSGNKKWTLENALPFNLKKSNLSDALQRPEPIHRLDYATSGLVLIGKTWQAVIALNKLFEEKHIDKTYMAITIGRMPKHGKVDKPINGRPCLSSFTLLDQVKSDRFDFLNLVKLTPHTGRTHQLRIHMKEIACPILGDLKYGIEGKLLKGKGLYLHAYELSFVHPLSATELKVTAPLPTKYIKIFPDFES